MRRLRHILVGIDFSPQSRDALLTAMRLARRDGARVTVAHVVRTFMVESQWPTFFSLNWADAHQRAVAFANDRLHQAVMSIDTQDVQVDTEATTGDPATVIGGLAQERGADLIVLASSGKGELRRLVLGSTSERIIEQTTVPVWIAGPEGFLRPRKVVVGVDFTGEGARVLEGAAKAAHFDDAALHVLHVCRDPMHDNIVAFVSPDQAAQYRHVFISRQQQRLEDLCAEILGSPGPAPLTIEVRPGRADEGLQDRVQELDADLLVLGRSSRAQPPGTIGQTTHKTIHAILGNTLIVP